MDRRALDRFRKNKGAVVGLAIVVSIVLFSFVGPLFVPHSPFAPDFEHGRGPFGTPGAPSRLHLLGTDSIFRDLFVRLAHGGRLSLEVAFVATTIAITIGTAVGVVSGYFKGTRVRLDAVFDALAMASSGFGGIALVAGSRTGGFRSIGLGAWLFVLALTLRTVARLDALVRRRSVRVDDVLETVAFAALIAHVARRGSDALGSHSLSLTVVSVGTAFALARTRLARSTLRYPSLDFDDVTMRIVDVLLAFPFLLLLMALGAAIDRTTETTIFLVLGLTAWTGTARVIRGKTLQVRELDFIVASRALGQSTPHILVRHVLPNVMGLAIVLATNSVAGMIVAEASLAFLGLSLPPPQPSWGRMLEEGRQYYAMAPWLLVAPALAILLAVLGFNLLGEGLRDAFDPRDA